LKSREGTVNKCFFSARDVGILTAVKENKSKSKTMT